MEDELTGFLPFGTAVGVLATIHPACAAGEENGLPSPYSDALELTDQ